MKRVALLWWLAAAPAFALPSFDAVRAAHQPSDRLLLDRHGAPLHVLRVDATARRGEWLPLANLSPALREAIVLGEDRRFWDHAGVDWRALAGAAWANAWNTKTRGASTLTMQLVGLLDPTQARPEGGRSVAGKLAQIAAARELETRWTKAQVLEAYLNLVPLRGELVGVSAAAWQLFGKAAQGLDGQEAALLAALVRSPNAAPPVVVRRACELLRSGGRVCDGLDAAAEAAFARAPRAAPGPQLAPHFARLAGPGRSTLDAATQRIATEALARQLAELRGRNVGDAAAVVLDNISGEVRAWVSLADVDAVTARRQPGSTVKPFVYALAFERGLLAPESRIDDAPLTLAAGSGLYAPQNYDHRHRGPVSARVALASSLNVPAVKAAGMLGPDALFESFQAAGLKLAHNAGFHGPALALGSAEVTLLDLTNAYRMFAAGGVFTPPRWRHDVPGAAARRVFTPAAAWLVGSILADPSARAPGFGFDSPLVTRGFAAVKTGTSKDLRDNWCIGYTDRFTVGVWVGNASGAPMHGASGTSGAAPAWREIVAFLHREVPSRAPAPPHGIVSTMTAGSAAVIAPFGIQAPREGSIVVLDPEIPRARQQLVIEGSPGRWRLNGRPIGEGSMLRWEPRPGRFRLERLGPDGARDEVRFEVRAGPQAVAEGANRRSTAASITRPQAL